MTLAKDVEKALKYINLAEGTTRRMQKNTDNEITRTYESMEYSLAMARQELTAVSFTLKAILPPKESK